MEKAKMIPVSFEKRDNAVNMIDSMSRMMPITIKSWLKNLVFENP